MFHCFIFMNGQKKKMGLRPLTVLCGVLIVALLVNKLQSGRIISDFGALHQDVSASTDMQAAKGSTSVPMNAKPSHGHSHSHNHTSIHNNSTDKGTGTGTGTTLPTDMDPPTQVNSEEKLQAGTLTLTSTSTLGSKTKTEFSSSCSSINNINSQAWLQGPRISNAPQQDADGKDIDNFLMDANLLEHLPELTEQTICHANGRFRSTSNIATDTGTNTNTATSWNASDAQLVQDWELKLIYASLHDMMHAPARNEYEARRSCPNISMSSLPRQDYECPGTKYLVTAIPEHGLGASVRLGAMGHILMGIATDRIPLLLANTKPNNGPDWLQTPWKLVSCARGDLQCVFMPTTPCTIRIGDLNNATLMKESESRPLRRHGVMDAKFHKDKVVIARSVVAPAKMDKFPGMHKVIRLKFYRKAMQLIERYQEQSSSNTTIDPQKIEVLTKAAKLILEPDEEDTHEHYTYGHRHYRIPHAIMMYFFRPNVAAKQRMKEQLQEIIPDWLDPQDTLGLPIRGSDKCNSESTCLDFDKYMQLAKESWHDHTNTSALATSTTTPANKQGALVMTTEDPALFAQRLQYSKSSNFPLEFVVNEKDPLQGTGNAKQYQQAADDILISSMLAIQMQFHAHHVYGNCCSNFHALLFDFLREGCGMTTQTTCLQETENYNICCQWTKTEACALIREDYKQQRANQTRMENDRKQKILDEQVVGRLA